MAGRGVECPRCWGLWDVSRRCCTRCPATEYEIERDGFLPKEPPPPKNAPAPATEGEALKAELERLRKQNQQLRAKLKKLQAKTKHHLSERDRYRDLYAKADKALREESARHPNF